MVDQPTNQPTPVVWQLVAFRPIAELDQLFSYLNINCKRYVAQQHSADEQINRTHCHISIVDFKYTKVSLAKHCNKIGLEGSSDYGILTVDPDNKKPYSEEGLSVYVIKGLDAPATQYSGYTYDVIETFRNKWVNHKEIGISGQTSSKVRTLVQFKLKVESPAEQKIRKNDQVKLIMKRVREREQANDRMLTDSEIRDIIREFLCEWNEVVGIYKAIDLYDTVIMRLDKRYSQKWDAMFDNILEKRKCRQ